MAINRVHVHSDEGVTVLGFIGGEQSKSGKPPNHLTFMPCHASTSGTGATAGLENSVGR